MAAMHEIVPFIVILIICIQVFFFCKNFRRMSEFSKIFSLDTTWRLHKNVDGFVDGIDGGGNKIFCNIVDSINKYLGNSAGSVIDFGLLKDAVDRHCDSVEDDIAVLTPTPLYWGLAGTMLGVIIGLLDLIGSDAISVLMEVTGGSLGSASSDVAGGVTSLLSGVAWAMVASICGILLTTFSSLLFKKRKLQEEAGKNAFLAWMQSELLPALPSDTSEALQNLVRNLNKFNNTFAQNISDLGEALREVNGAYAIQAEIIKAVHDMDVMGQAKANVMVLRELEKCTDKLEAFNDYLDSIEGYTDAIHRFETLFNNEAGRVKVLEEIRNFFRQYKGSISKTTADADNALKSALSSIKESTSSNVNDLNKIFAAQSEEFKRVLQDEKETFEQLAKEMRVQFSSELSQMPKLNRQLEEISAIPKHLESLIGKIEKSNEKLVQEISKSVRLSSPANGSVGQLPMEEGIGSGSETSSLPYWMKLTGWGAVVIIALTGVIGVVIYFYDRFM